MSSSGGQTIGEFLGYLLGSVPIASHVFWPPDAFACAALLLERSAAYLHVVSGDWPPPRQDEWSDHVCALGAAWRKTAVANQVPPKQIQSAWKRLLSSTHRPLEFLTSTKGATVRNALLEILASADEACQGVGILGDGAEAFDQLCLNHLVSQVRPGGSSSLCKVILPDKACVLPKMHTPQSGMTIRSLSHHLGVCAASEVKPQWIPALHPGLSADRHGLNVLVLPWPLEIEPKAFSPTGGQLRNMNPEKFGFFQFKTRSGKALDIERLKKVIKLAALKVGRVDVVILPELALTWKDRTKISALIFDLDPRPILISGMSIPGRHDSDPSRNSSLTIIPLEKNQAMAWTQDKHHRWLLDGSQVKQYGLGSVLDPTVSWWEHAFLKHRELAFFSLLPWLTFSTLICEDLARPDPVATLLRAVGPNLVFALLMDGPQLSHRWPARYGTVLADDPGSSVLTVSPLGMVKLSKPAGCKASRVVALWKDARSGAPTEIELPEGHDAILLSLTREYRNEISADGRDDDTATSYLTLCGIHPIK